MELSIITKDSRHQNHVPAAQLCQLLVMPQKYTDTGYWALDTGKWFMVTQLESLSRITSVIIASR
jgi:hypothetical protein